MAATVKDYSEIPSIVTITNSDPGVIDKDATSVDSEGKKVKIVYLTEPQPQKVQLYRVNFWVELEKVGDSIKIVAQTSEEAAYYAAMNSDRLTVKVEKVASSATGK